MDVNKHFLAGFRNVVLNTVYLIIVEERWSPKLLSYVKLLNTLPFDEGSYHDFYGKVKRLVDSFIIHWTESMDETVKEADRLTHMMDKEKLLWLVNNSIELRKGRRKIFDEMFLPIETAEQQMIYDDLDVKYQKHMEGLYKMQAEVEKLDKQFKVVEYVKDKIPAAVDKKYQVFKYAHTYIAMVLADRLPHIRGSLLEILRRLRCNIKKLHEESNLELSGIIDELYSKHKEQLKYSRSLVRSSADVAEVNSDIKRLREKVERHMNSKKKKIVDLEEEERYFTERLKEFDQIANTLNKFKMELEEIEREEAAYKSVVMTELPGNKYQCWENIGRSCAERKRFVKEKITQTAAALVTFFSVRGPNYMVYADNVGPYFIDEYGHQVYLFDSGLQVLHVDCERKFKEFSGEDVHFYDNKGRYILKNGEKVYMNMNCTSSYQLGSDDLLKRITVDCGHSEKFNPDCGMTIRDPNDLELLPKTEHVDIKRTLNTETVQYLWDAMGAILPLALHDVGMLQPKNPIHYLAHRLIIHKYGKTEAEHRKLKQEAQEYRAKILKDRKEKIIAETKAWKAKLSKRSKPETSDDTLERSVYDAYVATNELINSINYG